jgi:isopenicillin N synthase-like dioxygenase
MTELPIPLIDLRRWHQGDRAQRAALAAELDHALRESGFLLVAGHGIDAGVRERIRASARAFFALAPGAKAAYATPVGGRGWVGQGRELNTFYGEAGDPARADLKETYTIGRELRTGDPDLDRAWFTVNVWPAEVPQFAAQCAGYAEAVRRIYAELLRICAVALGLDADWFVNRTLRSPHTFNINRYPPLRQTGRPAEGQYRIGPHTDWGVLTVLDRQVGYGGLEVQARDGDWRGAPHVPDALTVNIGDLMARWTGDRWRSTRHRVLPPSADAPDEELISLIMFLEADVDTVITPLPAPIGRVEHPPITAGDYLLERAAAATVA